MSLSPYSERPFEAAKDLVCVIMAGGAGTRFWPASTEERPKQFLALTSERTLIQQTYDRIKTLVDDDRILVLTSDRFVGLVREQLPSLPQENVVGEPMRRDTAAAVGLAASIVDARFKSDDARPPVMAVLTSDHVITPDADFQNALVSAAKGASESGALYTFGIVPTHPATGYGYLALDAEVKNDEGILHHRLLGLVEKPDFDRAKAYLEGGKHLWNSGIFVWTTEAILKEFDAQLPEHRAHLKKAGAAFAKPGFEKVMHDAFEPLKKISVDYGIMEGAQEIRCVRAEFDWSDVGGFVALAEHIDRDDNNNALKATCTLLDAKNNVVFSEDENEHIALLGVEGLVVVRSKNKTLVTTKERAEEIKKLVALLPTREQ